MLVADRQFARHCVLHQIIMAGAWPAFAHNHNVMHSNSQHMLFSRLAAEQLILELQPTALQRDLSETSK